MQDSCCSRPAILLLKPHDFHDMDHPAATGIARYYTDMQMYFISR